MQIEVPRRRVPGIRLTPLIDVVFILLVFFMLASSFLDWRAFDLSLPAANATADPDSDPIVIAVGAEGGLRVDGRAIEPAALVERVRALRDGAPGRAVVLRAAEATSVSLTVRTLDRLRSGGIESVSLAAASR